MSVALNMSLQKDLRRMKLNKQHAQEEREKTERLRKQARELRFEFPHVGPTKTAMWAIAKLGIDKCRAIAAQNLSAFLFRKKVSES